MIEPAREREPETLERAGLEVARIYELHFDEIDEALAHEVSENLPLEQALPRHRAMLHRELAAHIRDIAQDDWSSYLANIRELGEEAANASVELPSVMQWTLVRRRALAPLLISGSAGEPDRASALVSWAGTLFDRELEELAGSYNRVREQLIGRQAQAIRELSTPVVEVWDSVLALPLIGAIDSGRAQQVMENLLGKIIETQARVVLIDITGVPVVDTQVASYLISATRAARLLGAKSYLAGISPQVAQTLVDLGVDLRDIQTTATLKTGLEDAILFISDEEEQP